MDRRAFITTVGGSMLAGPLAAKAQQVGLPDAALAFFETGSERVVPVLVIPATEIMSVMVEPNRGSYRATIRVDPNAARRLYQFTERSVGKRVDLRFGDERLSTLSIVAPVSTGLVRFPLTRHSAYNGA